MATPPKKKAAKKKAAKPKVSKLGHDPLSWIDDAEAENLKQENRQKHEISEPVEQEDTGDTTENHEQAIAPVEEAPAEIEAPVEAVEEVVEEEVQVEPEAEEDSKMLDLPVYFGIAQVAEVYQKMQPLVESSDDPVEIKADDVESVDTAALQLLLGFVKQLEEKGKSVKWMGCSDKFNSSVIVLNMGETLGIS